MRVKLRALSHCPLDGLTVFRLIEKPNFRQIGRRLDSNCGENLTFGPAASMNAGGEAWRHRHGRNHARATPDFRRSAAAARRAGCRNPAFASRGGRAAGGATDRRPTRLHREFPPKNRRSMGHRSGPSVSLYCGQHGSHRGDSVRAASYSSIAEHPLAANRAKAVRGCGPHQRFPSSRLRRPWPGYTSRGL
jgi:hypothetical protein